MSDKKKIGRPRENKQRIAYTMRLRPKASDKFKMMCESHGLSQTEMLTKMIDDYED